MLVTHWKNRLFDADIVAKKQIVSGLDIRQDTGQNLLRTHSAALREHNILTTVMTNIVVDKNEDHTKALTIFLITIVAEECKNETRPDLIRSDPTQTSLALIF